MTVRTATFWKGLWQASLKSGQANSRISPPAYKPGNYKNPPAPAFFEEQGDIGATPDIEDDQNIALSNRIATSFQLIRFQNAVT